MSSSLPPGSNSRTFARLTSQSLGNELGGVVQEFVEIARAKSVQAELGQNVLLPAQPLGRLIFIGRHLAPPHS